MSDTGWTNPRVESLKSLWLEGLSASQVAKQLGGVTRNAVIGKIHRLGISGRVAGGNAPPRIGPPVLSAEPPCHQAAWLHRHAQAPSESRSCFSSRDLGGSGRWPSFTGISASGRSVTLTEPISVSAAGTPSVMARTAPIIIGERTNRGRPPRLTVPRSFAGFSPALPPRVGHAASGSREAAWLAPRSLAGKMGEIGELRSVPSRRGEALWLL